MMHSSQHLQLAMGMVVAVPIPSEAEAEGQVVEEATQRALREAEQDRISGSAVSSDRGGRDRHSDGNLYVTSYYQCRGQCCYRNC
jgi:hypothetical protein